MQCPRSDHRYPRLCLTSKVDRKPFTCIPVMIQPVFKPKAFGMLFLNYMYYPALLCPVLISMCPYHFLLQWYLLAVHGQHISTTATCLLWCDERTMTSLHCGRRGKCLHKSVFSLGEIQISHIYCKYITWRPSHHKYENPFLPCYLWALHLHNLVTLALSHVLKVEQLISHGTEA